MKVLGENRCTGCGRRIEIASPDDMRWHEGKPYGWSCYEKAIEGQPYRVTHLVRMWKPYTEVMKSYPFQNEVDARKAYDLACELWPDWTVQLSEFDGRQLEYREAGTCK